MLFRIRGADTQDYAAVQAHISSLEQFQAETILTGRKSFVAGLAEGKTPKIMASQVPSLQDLVTTMTNDQFEKFKKSYEELPANPLMALHGQPSAGPATPGGAEPPVNDELDIAREIVAQHRRAGMKEDVLKETESFKKMTALEAAAAK
jgi:hypothetical protein